MTKEYLNADFGIVHQYGVTLEDDDAINEMLSKRKELLHIKLAVFSTAIIERRSIETQNLVSLTQEKQCIEQHMRQFNGLFDNMESMKTYFELSEKLASITSQLRAERREAWNDCVGLLRDCVATFEALELAKARGRFLSDSGGRLLD